MPAEAGFVLDSLQPQPTCRKRRFKIRSVFCRGVGRTRTWASDRPEPRVRILQRHEYMYWPSEGLNFQPGIGMVNSLQVTVIRND